MVEIYGCSDDLVEIFGSKYSEDEIGCYKSKVHFWFEDGTEIEIGYCKPEAAVWWIEVLESGTAYRELILCDDEDAEPYSDILRIDSEIVGHEVIEIGG